MTCDKSNQVAGLNLGGLAGNGLNPAGTFVLGVLLEVLQQLPALQVSCSCTNC